MVCAALRHVGILGTGRITAVSIRYPMSVKEREGGESSLASPCQQSVNCRQPTLVPAVFAPIPYGKFVGRSLRKPPFLAHWHSQHASCTHMRLHMRARAWTGAVERGCGG